jgi:hypothetical protein
MSEYLKSKIPASATSKAEDFLADDRSYAEKLKELIASKPQMVDDFQKPVAKDLPVEKIDRRGAVQPLTSGADFAARQAARQQAIKAASSGASDVLDYGQLKKEFADKARSAARSPAGRKVLGAVPFAGAAYAALSGEPAMAAEELSKDAIESAPTALAAAARLGALSAPPIAAGMIASDFIIPESAGDVQEDKNIIAESKAFNDYQKSPAHLARLEALKKLR